MDFTNVVVKAHANGRNRLQHCCVLLGFFCQQCLIGFKLYATSANIVVVPCKRTQHVGPNSVACCWPAMLRPFAGTLIFFFFMPFTFETALLVGAGIITKIRTKATTLHVIKGLALNGYRISEVI